MHLRTMQLKMVKLMMNCQQRYNGLERKLIGLILSQLKRTIISILMIWIEYYRLLFQNEAIAIQGTLFGLNLIGRKNYNRIQIMKSKILLSYNNTYLCIQKCVPKIQTDVERCKAVKTLFKGLTSQERYNLLRNSAIQTDFRLLVAPP